MAELPFLGAGVSFREAWRWEVIRHRGELGAVECMPEDVAGAAGMRDLVLMRDAVPILLHGIGLSLGSAEGLDAERVRHTARVAEVHLAGGVVHGGQYVDSHTRPVPEESWALLEWLVSRAPVRAVIVERDDELPPFADLLAEVRRARKVLDAADTAR